MSKIVEASVLITVPVADLPAVAEYMAKWPGAAVKAGTAATVPPPPTTAGSVPPPPPPPPATAGAPPATAGAPPATAGAPPATAGAGADVDSDGVAWDPAIHSTPATKTKSGKWGKRRGRKAPPTNRADGGPVDTTKPVAETVAEKLSDEFAALMALGVKWPEVCTFLVADGMSADIVNDINKHPEAYDQFKAGLDKLIASKQPPASPVPGM